MDHHNLTDSGVQKIECSKGHEFGVVYDGAKFEILFDVGMSAARDGYAREAVSSFAASLERFYEFYVTYAFFSNEIEESTFKSSWKLVASQSERQLGGFVFLYTMLNKKSPEVLSSNESSFRNKVIHKGYIPSVDESLSFGKSVYEKIMVIVRELESTGRQELLGFYQEQRPSSQGISWAIHEGTKVISLSREKDGTCDWGFDYGKGLFFRG